MNKSREYLKQLSVKERELLAEKLNIAPEYLYQIGAGIRSPSRRLALKLEDLTGGKVKELDFDKEIKVHLRYE